MSYQVLARKYRPRTFEAMVGQEHALRALVNALNQNRLHHAYLFTGTRGVGKTTLARLLAKCFNCEQGVNATPCNTCQSCQEINEGRFVDLIEVDAASRTKVEDTRDLLENVQYKPSHGRYKVYIIDEVHMLSGHSFNALLKTLEEPPPHVKFLLATTDPQRLPVTILSRCLQFHLKNLTIEQIKNQLQFVLGEENISFENNALQQLARAAQGSMRDALSLLDQAVAYGNNSVLEKDIRVMLGTIEQTHIFALLTGLAANDGPAIFATINNLVEQGVDFNLVLEDLLSFLHRIAVAQAVPEMITTFEDSETIKMFAAKILPEDIQLYYQIGLIGRRDLPLAPRARTGFEMLLLRMLAFTPNSNIATSLNHKTETATKNSHSPATQTTTSAPTKVTPTHTPPTKVGADIDWAKLISQININGFAHALAMNCALKEYSEEHFHLLLDPNQTALRNPKQEARLKEALSTYFAKPINLQISLGDTNVATPNRILHNQQTAQQQIATKAVTNDPNIQALLSTFNATIQPNSIHSKEENNLSPERETN